MVRASGPATRDAVQQLTQCAWPPRPRVAHLLTFYHPHTREPIDKGLLLWFPGEQPSTVYSWYVAVYMCTSVCWVHCMGIVLM